MDLIGPVLLIVDNFIWTPISNCVKYHRSLEESIKILEEKLNELNCRKDDIESGINEGLGRGKIVKKEVELWLQKVNKINIDKHLEHEVGKAKYFSRARLGRLVAKKIQEVEELYKKGKFSNELMVDAVAVPVVVNAVPLTVDAAPVAVDADPLIVDVVSLIVDAVPVVVHADSLIVHAVPVVVDADRADPLIVDVVSLIVDAVPVVVDADPSIVVVSLIVDAVPLIDAVPVVVDADPLIVDAVPLIADADPLVDAVSLIVDAVPLIVETVRVVVDADPVIVDADSLVVDAIPLIVDTDSLVVDADPGHEKFSRSLPSKKRSMTTTQRKLAEIWMSFVCDPKVGVYGMGGIGKTTIIKHIHNLVLEEKGVFGNAIWITMPKAMDIINIQSHIASALNVEMKKYDVSSRAKRINEKLLGMRRWVLILDDMWEAFNLEDVGIPEPTMDNECKLVLTTRSLKVCQQMSCECIKIELLSEDEAWNLFLDKVGPNVPMSPDLEVIAKQVAKECARLPLAIVTIGRSMSGVVDKREWRNALNELQRSLEGLNDMGKVIQQLKFSYTYLGYEKLQRSLLYCALYPEDYQIKRDELIAYLIAEEIVKRTGSREQSFDEGHTILNKLENACLLESCTNSSGAKCVRMHDVIRDMALHILGPTSMVEAGVQLRYFPDAHTWTEDLETVSLMYSNINEIPPDASPSSSRLKTLLLLGNKGLTRIPDCFFVHIPSLQLLDISFTNIIVLPNSISNLEHLMALRLNGCSSLKYVPSLEKLRGLRELNLSLTKIEEIPQGLEMLVNLQYLNLYLCEQLKTFQTGILPKLIQLQYLSLYFGSKALNIKGEEVASLVKLETLVCQFDAVNDLNTFVRSTIIQQRQLPNSYMLQVGPLDSIMRINFSLWGDREQRKYVGVSNDSIRRERKGEEIVESIVLLPEDADEFYIGDWDKLSSLSSVLVRQGVGASSSLRLPLPPATFSYLRKLDITNCQNMKELFTPRLEPDFQNLEEMYVRNCCEMKEIFAAAKREEEWILSEGEGSNNYYTTGFQNVRSNNPCITITFPKLRVFHLANLPQLESIVSRREIMVCDLIQEIHVYYCPKLKRLPLSLPMRNGRPSPPSSLREIKTDNENWLDLLEWENAIAEDELKKRFLPCGPQSQSKKNMPSRCLKTITYPRKITDGRSTTSQAAPLQRAQRFARASLQPAKPEPLVIL